MSGRKASFLGVKEAAKKLADRLPATPLVPLKLRESTIWCKCESAQPVGAFKIRGAWHRLTALSAEERRAGVVAFSSGNHAQGVAWAARELGIAAAIVMPSDAPSIKIEGTRKLGAEIILYDRATDSREAIAAQIASEHGAVLVPSFDDPWIIEGQGSIGIELAEQLGRAPDVIITPCGGGGLAAGIALACPESRLFIVEPSGWDDMTRSLATGVIELVGPNPPPTLCDSIQTLRVAERTFGILSDHGAKGVSASEEETIAAMRLAHDALGLVIEPGGAVGLAAAMAGKVDLADHSVVILSGGNVDPELFARLLG